MELREYQHDFINGVAVGFYKGFTKQLGVLPTGGGKCLAAGTPILMFDGSVKPVESIRVGDSIMGPDSKPRRVLSLARGREEMFKVTPKKGSPYTVNRSHILSLRITGTLDAFKIGGRIYKAGDIANVNIDEYLNATKTFRHCAKGWRVGVEFRSVKTPKELTPYILGVWLGDGVSRLPSIASIDQEVIREVNWHALSLGLNMREERVDCKCPLFHITPGRTSGGRGREYNPVKKALRAMGLLQNKHVPIIYKINDRNTRLEVLAGLMDTDGSYSGKGFDYISKLERLADDVVFIARSLGLAAYKSKCIKTCANNGASGDYYRVSISGDVDIIPCRVPRKKAAPRKQIKNVLNVGIKVEPVGIGDYYGFEIDADRLFLLGDFTVTHNTICFASIAQRFHEKRGEKTLVLAHREELIQQAADKIYKTTGLVPSIEKAGDRASKDSPVVVGSIQTLQGSRLESWAPDHFGLVVVDEAHHVLADSYLSTLGHFNTRVLGVTATPDRGDRKNLATYFENLAYEIGILDLIGQGFLSPVQIKSAPLKIDLNEVKRTGGDYDANGLDAAITPYLGEIARYIAQNCQDRRRIVAFLPLVATSQRFVEECRKVGIDARHVDGSSPDRKEILDDYGAGKFRLLSNAMLLTEGWDEPGVDCVLILRPTRSRSLYAQMVGRGTRLFPGKDFLLLLDFLWLHERHDLIKPASLVARNKEEEDRMTKIIENSEGKDLEDAMNEAEAEREAALIREIAENASRREKFITLEQAGAVLKDSRMRDYEPVFPWETQQITDKQRSILDRFGIRADTKGEAAMIMNRLFDRSRGKLATVKQLRWLVKYGHPSPETCTQKEATAFLDAKWGKTSQNIK